MGHTECPETGRTVLGVQIMRTYVYWASYWGPLSGETATYDIGLR